MSRIRINQTTGRLAALGLLLLSLLGPWLAESHPATEETCTAPLFYWGDGYCACIVSIIMAFRAASAGVSSLGWISLPPLLPILFTLLLFLGRNHRFLWYFHLMAWFLVAVYSLFFFIENWALKDLFLWGAGLGSAVAVLLLAGEILAINHQQVKV